MGKKAEVEKLELQVQQMQLANQIVTEQRNSAMSDIVVLQTSNQMLVARVKQLEAEVEKLGKKK